jgi:hypothetical protein
MAFLLVGLRNYERYPYSRIDDRNKMRKNNKMKQNSNEMWKK